MKWKFVVIVALLAAQSHCTEETKEKPKEAADLSPVEQTETEAKETIRERRNYGGGGGYGGGKGGYGGKLSPMSF